MFDPDDGGGGVYSTGPRSLAGRAPTPPPNRRHDQRSFDSSNSNDSGVVVQGEKDAAAMAKLVSDMKKLESRVAQGERLRTRSDSVGSSTGSIDGQPKKVPTLVCLRSTPSSV